MTDCPYCGKPAEKVAGTVIYPHRPDLAAKPFWRCDPCKAWVGCHPGTSSPLGRLANGELRAAKRYAHAAFDPLWQVDGGQRGSRNKKNRRRSHAYAALAAALNIPADQCHIGMFDVALCQRTVEVCKTLIIQPEI